jgi:glycosyltransferase involved in cell wall biosynthesis
MIVAVDTRFTKAYREFIFECFRIITAQYPQHTFIIISGKPAEPSLIGENIIPVVLKDSTVSLLQQFKTSSILKKYNAEVFVTARSINSKVPQCVIAVNNAMPASLNKANTVVSGSAFLKREFIEKYNIEEARVDVVYEGVNELFQPIHPDQKEQVKEGYADGNEYFLSAVSSNDELLNLLKAFSVFKKMQKSIMQLLVAFPDEMNAEFLETLRLYKYKSEVKLVNPDVKELALITAAAYAFVYPSGHYAQVFPAMRCNVPVITSDTGVMHEMTADAAVYFNSNDYKDIADKMMLLYKDEKLRAQLIEKGNEQVDKYSWNISAQLLWKSIEKAAK